MSILPRPEPDLMTADDLRALADAIDAGTIRVMRHENLLAVLKPEQVITIGDVLDADTKERRAAKKTLKRSPRR